MPTSDIDNDLSKDYAQFVSVSKSISTPFPPWFASLILGVIDPQPSFCTLVSQSPDKWFSLSRKL
ncbi:MAG: hypothetical protein GY742_21370 [Hyphomicrobiales bacterium]|nr:hypothetical protein [Hyphomicrobiales bacterium]